MSIDVEYAIRKDIRNNPIVREVDDAQKRDFMKTVLLAGFIVALVLFAAFQPFRMVSTGYRIEELRSALSAEESVHRQLLLNVETLRAPQVIEDRAIRELHLIRPTAADTLILERATTVTPGHAVVASAR